MVSRLDSTISAVRLYRTGAIVTRRTSVDADEGPLELSVGGLPLSLDDPTLRLTASAGAVVSQVRVAIDLAAAAGRASLDEDALRALATEEAALRADVVATARARQALDKLGPTRRQPRSDGQPPGATEAQARVSLVRLRSRLARHLVAEHHRLQAELERVAKRRAVVADELERTSGARAPDPLALRKTAVATLHVAAAGSFAIELSYFVPGALWAPAYVLRIDSRRALARLELRASVCQSSGEDWTNVAVSFATADAMRFHELPELLSQRVGRAQAPPRKRSYRALQSDAGELFADYARALGAQTTSDEGSGFESLDQEVTNVVAAPPPPEAQAFFGGAPPSFAAQERSVPPPQAPMMAPRSAMAMSPPSFSGPPSMGMTAPMRGGGGAPASIAAPAGARRTRRMIPGWDHAAQGVLGSLAEPVMELDASLLDFESLRMPPPEMRSGRLAVASREQLYVEQSQSLASGNLTALAAVLGSFRAQCERALSVAPPPRQVLPHHEGGFHHTLVGQFSVDVPSDGAFHSLPVVHGEAELSMLHVVVPRESVDVFRQAILRNPLSVPLLPGPCDVYIGDDFLLTVDLPTVSAQAELRVGLGVEQSIKVARNTHFAESTQGLMSGTLLLKHQIEIEVVSHLPAPAAIEVRERVPAAQEREEDIKIEVSDVSPPWQPWQAPPGEPEVRGGFVWRLRVEPRGRADLRASYTVRIPSKLELVGGNRRE